MLMVVTTTADGAARTIHIPPFLLTLLPTPEQRNPPDIPTDSLERQCSKPVTKTRTTDRPTYLPTPPSPHRNHALLQVHSQLTTKQPPLINGTSFFKTLTNQTVTIELKNDIRIRGTLKSVDQYLNIKLDDVDVLDLDKYPHLSSVKNMFIRGSVVRYVMLPRSEVDIGLLEDATRRGK